MAARCEGLRPAVSAALSAKGITLTAKVATRLNKKLRMGKLFSEGQPIGSLKT